jgi:hypothetical protein
MTRRRKLTAPTEERYLAAGQVFAIGIDVLRDFPGEEGKQELERVWALCGEEWGKLYEARDPTLRLHGWWWFTAPPALRVQYPEYLSPTEQRRRLLEHNVLTGADRAIAERCVAMCERSGVPEAFYDLRHDAPNLFE